MNRVRDRISASTGWRAAAVQGGSFCAVPAAGGGGGGGTTAEFLPIALLLAALTGAAVWMFHRWGGRTESGGAEQAQAPSGVDERPYGHAPTTHA